MLLQALALCLALQTDRVTLNVGIAPTPAVVSAIAQQTGLKLRVSPILRDEPLAVHLTNRPVNEVLAWVAKAADAEWERSGEELVLTRSAALQKRQRALTAERIGVLAKASVRAQLVGDLEHFDWQRLKQQHRVRAAQQEQNNDYFMPLGISPGDRLLARLLLDLPDAAVGEPELGRKLAWASAAGPLARALPKTAGSAVALYLREQETLRSELRGRGQAAARDAAALGSATHPDDPPPKQVRLRLVISRSGATWSEGWLWIWSDTGTLLHEGVAHLTFDLRDGRPAPPRVERLERMPFTSDFERFASTEQASPIADSALSEEPLALFLADLIQALQRHAIPEMVVALPDEVAGSIALSPSAAATMADAYRALGDRVDLSVDQDVLIGHPRFPSETAAVRADRAVLRRLLATLLRDPIPELDDFVRYATDQRIASPFSGLEERIASTLGGWRAAGELHEVIAGFPPITRDVYRLYGMLPRAQREQLWRGQPLSLRDLSTAARSQLHQMVFTRDWPIGQDLHGRFNTSDPCEAFPGGLPSTTLLRPEPSSETQLLIVTGRRRFFVGPESLGNAVFHTRNVGPDVPALEGWPKVLASHYVPLNLHGLGLQVEFTPGVRGNLGLVAYQPLGNRNPVPLGKLPEAIFNTIKASHDALRDGQSKVGPLVRSAVGG